MAGTCLPGFSAALQQYGANRLKCPAAAPENGLRGRIAGRQARPSCMSNQ